MKRIVVGAVGLLAWGAAAPAVAADLPAQPYTKAPAMIAAQEIADAADSLPAAPTATTVVSGR